MDDVELDNRLALLTEVGDFRAKAKRVIVKAVTECLGCSYRPRWVFGLRLRLTQRKLFAQGRVLKAPGLDPNRYGNWTRDHRPEAKPIVTWALPEDSAHCYGAALDLALVDRESSHWLMDGHWAWGLLAGWVEAEGLTSGHRWPAPKTDSAHMELKGWSALAQDGKLALIG